MSLWQCKFFILPKKGVDILCPDHHFEKNEEENWFDDEHYWLLHPLSRKFFSEMQAMLPISESWSEFIDLYGEQDSNCVEVLFNSDDVVMSASFRIDFTHKYNHILKFIIEFCSTNQLVILDESLKYITLSIDCIENSIMKSPQLITYMKIKGK